MTEEVDDFLAHFGVKGMHWGVRNDKPVTKDAFLNPKSSKELVKAARTNAKASLKDAQSRRIERTFDNYAKTPLDYSKLSTKKVTINKGQELYRLSKRKDETLRDMTYVSTNAKDRDIYRSVLSDATSLRTAKAKYSGTYEATFQAVKTLKSPSEKERVDAFVDILNTPSINVGVFKPKMVTGREYLNRSGFKGEIKKLDTQTVGLKFYNSMAQDQFLNNKLNTAYFNNIRARGYNALVDDNDRNILTKQPLMILDPAGSIKRLSFKQLTNDDINTALATLKPIKVD